MLHNIDLVQDTKFVIKAAKHRKEIIVYFKIHYGLGHCANGNSIWLQVNNLAVIVFQTLCICLMKMNTVLIIVSGISLKQIFTSLFSMMFNDKYKT